MNFKLQRPDHNFNEEPLKIRCFYSEFLASSPVPKTSHVPRIHVLSEKCAEKNI